MKLHGIKLNNPKNIEIKIIFKYFFLLPLSSKRRQISNRAEKHFTKDIFTSALANVCSVYGLQSVLSLKVSKILRRIQHDFLNTHI